MDTPRPDTDALTERLQSALGADFRIERELGGGGMSRVFVARDVALDRAVVIKVLPDSVAEGLSADRFRREITLSAGLQHPNIVPVIAGGSAEGLPYFVMPFVEGESLRARVTRGPLSVPDAVATLRDVCRALAYAHARGIIHRDIKPDNVLLSGGAAVVADFGVAKALVASAPDSEGTAAQTLTRVGMSLGTPSYMAPEQVVADPDADQRVDIYALGILAYEMLTGQPPFQGRSVSEVMSAHLTKVPESVAVKRAGVPHAFAQLIAQCLEKDPAKRPQNAEEILRLLEDPAVVSGAVPSLVHIPALRVARAARRWKWMAGMAVLLTLGGLGWIANGRARSTEPTAAPVIAVLPLQLASPDSSDAYLAQGIADELLNALARIPGVRVASRLAARSIAGSASPRDAAARAGVTLTLDGTVVRRGDRVRVSAELARVDGVSVWTETYDRPANDLYALQGDIASSVAAVVQAGVARGTAEVAATPNVDPQAYDAYLRGHYLLARRGGASLREAIGLFESAVKADSNFARAYAELAQANAVLPLYTGGGRGSLAQAERAAARAMQLDSSLAPAHAVMGYLHNVNWRWAEGRASLERAVSLDSSDATALQWLAENLMMTGQFARARDVYAIAYKVDTESPIIPALLAVTQALSGEEELAVRTGRAVVDANPSQAVPRFMLGTLLAYIGRYPDAISELREARKLAPSVLAVAGSLGYALARSGDVAGARLQLAELRRAPDEAGVDPAIAKILAAMGDVDGAMAALQRGIASRDAFFSSEPLMTPMFAALRSHPDFPALLSSLGLDDMGPTRRPR